MKSIIIFLSNQYFRQAWVINIHNYLLVVFTLMKLPRSWSSMCWMIYKRQLKRWIVNVSRQNRKWCKHLNIPIFHPQILIWETSQCNIRLFFFLRYSVFTKDCTDFILQFSSLIWVWHNFPPLKRCCWDVRKYLLGAHFRN